jgi:hypothetical protein
VPDHTSADTWRANMTFADVEATRYRAAQTGAELNRQVSVLDAFLILRAQPVDAAVVTRIANTTGVDAGRVREYLTRAGVQVTAEHP